MDQELKVIGKAKPLTAQEVRDHVNLIQEVLVGVMKSKVHYDVIPGTNKPTLLKPGAEKILTTFRIAAVPEVEECGSDGEIRYRVIVKGVHQTTGIVVGAGVGECSSAEDKYAWRAVVCEEEWEATPEHKRRTKWNKGYNGKPAYSVQQVRTNPADLANTILKMAKKRAMVDLCLTATAASDVFDQDLDDLPPELQQQHAQKQAEAKRAPRTSAAGNSNKPATEAQCRLLRGRLNGANKTESDLCEAFGVESLEALPMGKVNDAIAWVEQ